MQQTRKIVQYQYQCKRSVCSHIWWSKEDSITRCPNCTRHNSAIAILEGQMPVPIDHESHKNEGAIRRTAQLKYRKSQ